MYVLAECWCSEVLGLCAVDLCPEQSMGREIGWLVSGCTVYMDLYV